METLKWIGCIVAAILVLSVIVGGGLFIALVIAILGALICLYLMVIFTAAAIKGICDPNSRRR